MLFRSEQNRGREGYSRAEQRERREREGGKEGIKLRRMQKIEKLKVETTRSTNAMERLEIKSKCGKKVDAKGRKISYSVYQYSR